MTLGSVRRVYEEWGRRDPLFAVLSTPDKRGNRWDPGEFFRTGVREVDAVMQRIEALGVAVRRDVALDFGCGVGRLTQALAAHFSCVYGVDISSSMLDWARHYDRQGGRCRYVLNASPALPMFADGTVDFVYSNIVLQHLSPRFARRYLGEFLRILRPGGLAVFHQPMEVPPSRPPRTRSEHVRRTVAGLLPRPLLRAYREVSGTLYSRLTGSPRVEMHGMPREVVEAVLRGTGGRVIAVESQDDGRGWLDLTYYVMKDGEERSAR